MKRIVVAGVALFAAVLIQLTVVNGLPFPGGGTPDLVLLCVVAIGRTAGPAAGLTAGFCAGLALDLAPPASQLVGQYALVLCLVGYGSGRLRFTLRHSALLALAFGYSVALGAFIAGTLVAESGEGAVIQRLIEPVRDMFVAIFFVSVGMLIDPRMIGAHWGAVLAFTPRAAARVRQPHEQRLARRAVRQVEVLERERHRLGEVFDR